MKSGHSLPRDGWSTCHGLDTTIKYSRSTRSAYDLNQSVINQGPSGLCVWGGILAMSRIRTLSNNQNSAKDLLANTASSERWDTVNPNFRRAQREGNIVIVKQDLVNTSPSVSVTMLEGIIQHAQGSAWIGDDKVEQYAAHRKVFDSGKVTSCIATRDDFPSSWDDTLSSFFKMRYFLQARPMFHEKSTCRIGALSHHPKTQGFDSNWSSGAHWRPDSLDFPLQKITITAPGRNSTDVTPPGSHGEQGEVVELFIAPLSTQVMYLRGDKIIQVSVPLMDRYWRESSGFRWLDHIVHDRSGGLTYRWTDDQEPKY